MLLLSLFIPKLYPNAFHSPLDGTNHFLPVLGFIFASISLEFHISLSLFASVYASNIFLVFSFPSPKLFDNESNTLTLNGYNGAAIVFNGFNEKTYNNKFKIK